MEEPCLISRAKLISTLRVGMYVPVFDLPVLSQTVTFRVDAPPGGMTTAGSESDMAKVTLKTSVSSSTESLCIATLSHIVLFERASGMKTTETLIAE